MEIGADAPERGDWLVERGAVGWLRPEVERLLAVPGTLAAAARLLLELHFTSVLAELICAEVDLDLPALDVADHAPVADGGRGRRRRSGFAEEVLRAYAYRCAMCGFDGASGRNPVGIEAAHVRWHSHYGPDRLDNAVALCSLHHALFDLGVLGLTGDHLIRVSDLYMARTDAGRSVEVLAGRPLLVPRPGDGGGCRVCYLAWPSGVQVRRCCLGLSWDSGIGALHVLQLLPNDLWSQASSHLCHAAAVLGAYPTARPVQPDHLGRRPAGEYPVELRGTRPPSWGPCEARGGERDHERAAYDVAGLAMTQPR